MTGRFIVRQLVSPTEVRQVFLSRAVSLGRRPGALDHENFFAADPTGFYAGELDGKVISCFSAVKYSKDLVFFGNYVVDEPYRGKGYGVATTEAVQKMVFVSERCNFGSNATEKALKIYNNYDMKPYWKIQRKTVVVPQSLSSLAEIKTKDVIIRPACEISFQDILDYDTSVHVYARPAFLKKWISAPNCFSYVALGAGQNGTTVMGYTVVRSTMSREDGWRIGPLFADNSQIAKSLYQKVFQQVSKVDPKGVITIDVPHGKPLEMIEELPPIESMVGLRMYKNGIPPNLPLSKVFAHTALEIA